MKQRAKWFLLLHVILGIHAGSTGARMGAGAGNGGGGIGLARAAHPQSIGDRAGP